MGEKKLRDNTILHFLFVVFIGIPLKILEKFIEGRK